MAAGDYDENEMDFDEGEIEMDADDDGADINVIMPPPPSKTIATHNPNLPKSKPPRVASHWSDLSENWNAEETGRVRPQERLYGSGVHQVTRKANRGFVDYEDEFSVEPNKNIETRLDFENRKAAWEMKKLRPAPPPTVAVVDELDEDDDGELASEGDEDGEEGEKSEPENDESDWSKRLKGPRMRMYADEEEAIRKRNNKIKKLYGQREDNLPPPTDLKVKVDFGGEDHMHSLQGLRTRRLSRDETTTGLGQRILDRDVQRYELATRTGSRRPRFEDEDEFRRSRLYTEELNRVSHRTIGRRSGGGGGGKPSIKDRLGIRPLMDVGRSRSSGSIKSRLGANPRGYLDR